MQDYGFSTDVEQVRVDVFRPSGKWSATVALRFDTYKDELIHDVLERCMREQYPEYASGYILVCLDPYHEHSHPLMIKD